MTRLESTRSRKVMKVTSCDPNKPFSQVDVFGLITDLGDGKFEAQAYRGGKPHKEFKAEVNGLQEAYLYVCRNGRC